MRTGSENFGVTTPRVLLVVKGLDLGGLERVVVDLATWLCERGVEVEVALVNDRRCALAGEIESAGIALHRLGGSDYIGVTAARALTNLVNSGRFGVVHVHGPLPASLVRMCCWHTPIVTTSHTPFPSLHSVTRALWAVTARRDAVMIGVSAAVVTSLPARSRRRARVIPHGIDRRRIEALKHAGPPVHGGGPVQMITVAGHREAKNYPNLLRAVRSALDQGARLHLTAIGEGPRLDDHRLLASRLGLDQAVTFEPATHDVLARIAAADVLIVASDYEGQPLVVMEALALGRPVVATAVGRVPELVSPSMGRVVPPGDSEALAAAIAELAADPELRRRLGASAAASPHWQLDDVVDAHVALYREVVGHPVVR